MINKTIDEQKIIIGKNLAQLVKESNFSKDEILSKLISVSSWDSFNKYIVGRSFPTIPNIFILGELFGCGYEYILTGGQSGKRIATYGDQNDLTKDMEERLMEWKKLYASQSKQFDLMNTLLEKANIDLEKANSEIALLRAGVSASL